MNTIKDNDIEKLKELKNKIKEKERLILESQIKQNKLENQVKKAEQIKEKIINDKRYFLGRVISYTIYDVVMITILILFIKFNINKLRLTESIKLLIYILEMYIGVTTISISGAFISAKIECFFKKNYDKKRLLIITKKIKDKKEKIDFEKNIQEVLKKEITSIINNSKNDESNKIESNSENSYDFRMIIEKNETQTILSKKTKIKKL